MRLSDALQQSATRARRTSTVWLAVGARAAQAMRDAGLPPDVPVRRVRDVHRAIEVLDQGTYRGCVIDGRKLADRPAAALELLRVRVGSVCVVTRKGSTRLRRAARHLGIPLCTPPEPPTLEAAMGLEAEAAPQPTAPAPAPPIPLPRADAIAVPPGDAAAPASPGAFAADCLPRLGDVSALIRHTAEVLGRASKASRVSVMLVDDARRALLVRHAEGLDPSLVDTVRCPIGRGVAGRAASLGRPAMGYGESGGPRGYGGAAYVVLPLGTGARVLGVVNLTGLPDDRLPERADLERWHEIARLAGKALRNARRLQRAEAMMSTDALTGLPNRRAFERALGRELDRASRSGDGLAVALFDADDFKKVNDHFGHQAGDLVLATLAATLKKAFRDSDLVARWGGEEFAVLLPGQRGERPEASLRALERARKGVARTPVVLGSGHPPHRVTVSCGVAFHPRDGHDGVTLVRNADRALLEAKAAGKNTIRRP